MAKKKIKKLKTGTFSRSFSLASMSFKAGAQLAGGAISGLLQSDAAKAVSKKARRLSQATDLVQQLGELKGSLMKTGQMLGVYGEHFLPPEINALLRTLQADSPPLEWASIEKSISKQLGKEKLAQLEVENDSVGAASLGQVHRATIKKTGETIALKVQYHGVDKSIDSDLKALRRILSLTEWLPKLPATDELFEEVRSMLKREVNYELELEMLELFGKELACDDRYIVPKAYPEFSAKRVLAMSFEDGVAIDSPEVAALSQERRNSISLALLDLYFKELFLWRRVQTDPHFGNFKVRIGKGTQPDRLVLLDFGAVRELSATFVEKYAQLLASTFYANREAFEKAAASMGVLDPKDPADLKDLFYKLCVGITEPFLEPQPYDWRGSDLPQRVTKDGWEMFKKFPLRAPPRELVFLDRKMAGIFTLLVRLGAKVNGRALLKPYLG